MLNAEWEEPGTLTKRVTVYIQLPSGTCEGDFCIEVVDEGEALELKVKWPETMTNANMLF